MGSVGTILQSNNITRVARANYQAAIETQASNNELEKAKSTLAEFSRTLGNQLRNDAAGKEYNAAVSQLSKELTDSTSARVNAQLQASEAHGALSAQAGQMGVGGASVDLMDSLISLKQETRQEELKRAADYLARTGKRTSAQIIVNAANNNDLRQTLGRYEYQKFIEPKDMEHRFLTLVGVAVATWFGGPQAGEAAADAAVGEWQARNGDFTGANKSFGEAAAGAIGSYQKWGERGGESWGSNAFGTRAKSTGNPNGAAEGNYNFGSSELFSNTAGDNEDLFKGWY